MTDDQQPSSSSSSAATNREQQRSKRLSGFFNHLIHRREPPAPIQEESPSEPKSEDPPQPAPAVPPPRLPPPTLQELGLSLSVVTADLHPSHFTTPPSSGAFLSPNYLLLCHAQGLDVLPITSPPEPQPLPLIRRVSFKSIVVMEQRGVLVAIAGRRDGVRVYALEEIRKAVEWRIDVQIKREKERQRREQAKKLASAFVIESRISTEKARKPSSSTPPPGAQTSAKVSMPRKSSHSSMTTASSTTPTQPTAPPVPLIPRTPTIRKTKTPPRRAPNGSTSQSQIPEPSGHPPPYTPPSTDYFNQQSTPAPIRSTPTVSIRARAASVSEVLNAPPVTRINTNTDVDLPRDPDAKDGWTESSDDEAINIVAAGSSGSQALDERTSAIHNSPTNTQVTATTPQITTTPSPTHRRSLSRRNRPANLDLSLAVSNPPIPSEQPSPAPTLLTLRQALATNGPASESNQENSGGDPDDDDDDDGEISLTQALLESRMPDLPPPGSTRPQQPIFLSSSHSLLDEPASPRPSDANSSLTTRSETVMTSSTSSNNRRRRWSLMIGGSSSNPNVDQQVPQSPTSASLPNTADAATPPREHRSPNRLSRSRSHRSGTSPTPTRRPASANAETAPRSATLDLPPPLPQEGSALIPSASRSRFIPRIISNALHNIRSEDRPSTSPGPESDTRKATATSLVSPPPAAKLEYVKLPGTKGSLMIKAVETAKKSFLAILCGENGEKVELFAGTYRTALGLSRTFILPDSPRSLELQLQGDDLVEVFLVFSQNVFGLEPATVRVREVRIGRAERRAARRRAREARADAASASAANDSEAQGEEETNVNVSIGVSMPVGSTLVANGAEASGPQTPALIPSEHPQQQQEDRDRANSAEGNADDTGTPADGGTTSALAHAEELVALATARMGPYTTFQQLSFAPQFPLASIADEYVIPPTYPDFVQYREAYEPEEGNANSTASDSQIVEVNAGVNGHTSGNASESSSADATQVQFSPPGLPLPTPTAPSKWYYRDPKGVVHGPWRASLMQSWYKDSLLPPDLPVRREEDTDFMLLKELRQQSVDPSHPFSPAPANSIRAPTLSTVPPSPAPIKAQNSESSTIPVYKPTDKPLLKPISLLAQPRHFGPPALFFSSRGGHSTTIVDARGRSVLKERFFWSEDETGDNDTKPTSLTGGRMGDVKRLEAVDIKDRSVLIAMRQGGVEAVDLSDALLKPADDSRGALPQFSPAPSSVNRRAPFVWRIGTPVSSSSSSQTSTVLSGSSTKQHKSGLSSHSITMARPSKLTPSVKSPAGKTEFSVGGDMDSEFHDEVLFLGRREDEIYICERNAGSFRILRLSPVTLLFQDAAGNSVKFHIQGAIPPDVQAQLRQSIMALGGQIETAVPDQGIVLVEPEATEQERLVIHQTRPDLRLHVVPYTYIDACRMAGVIFKRIFVETEAELPMPMHIHDSIANPKFREELSERILFCGGNPYVPMENARVIIADPQTHVFTQLIKMSHHTPNKYVESLDWIKRCIERSEVHFTPHVYKNPGGRRAGEERTQFTDDDEHRLCEWIALKIPYKTTGGRTGNKLYIQLCEMVDTPGYEWVRRHTWQSWRERYKKNAERLDRMIDSIVTQTKPNPGDKGQYGYVRQEEDDKPKRKRKRTNPKTSQPQEFVVGSSGPPGPHPVPLGHPGLPKTIYPPRDHLPVPFLPGMHPPPPPRPASGAEEEGEWDVVLGADSPPVWAKRRASDDGGDDGKGQKTTDDDDEESTTQQTMQAIAVVAEHVIDQSLRAIADQFRFTLGEVREYYDKCGDMERTSKRFQKMREHLALLPDDP
ncbi:hypothetical protein VNI00_001447 [Paramarasmius palmivorus]|uniref:GYF domain-containing protein n=1 Tax=Paramarasmius palmivorus TaxID=297713 RepID=A0AAW0E0Z1_9AGAR